MLDENLPIFYFSESSDSIKHHETILLSRGGAGPEPAYSLRHADPSASNSKNCYAVALFDAYTTDVLFGEVLIRPQWTHPSLSAEDIRRNGGVAPPPEPILPTSFTVQLYNPELQINVTRETGLLGSTHYDFSMPQDTFRMPSGSMLDRTQHDPGAAQTTPRINFSMKKEGKLSKDYMLSVKGKSTDVVHKKRNKEPDIAIAMFKSLREVTVLESNLYRVEMEDAKGLEVVLLLISTVIRDVFHGQMHQAFNVSSGGRRRSSGARLSPTSSRPSAAQYTMSGGAGPATGTAGAVGPITDPRTQWELDAETQRLKRQAEDEARQDRRQADARRRERERIDAEETKRLQKLLEAEEKEARRKQAEVDKETARLQKLYGVQQAPAQASTRPQTLSAPISQGPFPNPPTQANSNLSTFPQYPQRPSPAPQPPHAPAPNAQYYPPFNPQVSFQQPPAQPQLPPRPQPYQQQTPHHSSRPSGSLHPQSASGLGALNAGASLSSFFGSNDKSKQKSSWNLRRSSDSAGGKLQKKTSSVF